MSPHWLWRILAVAGAAVALLGGLYMLERRIEQRGYDRAEAEHAAALERMHADAAAQLAEQVNKTRSAEQALNQATHQQDLKDATHYKTLSELSIRLHAVARGDDGLGGLRDPYARACGCSGGGPGRDTAAAASAGAGDPAQAGGLLSAELAEFLVQQARSADDINVAYASCRADALTVRGVLPVSAVPAPEH